MGRMAGRIKRIKALKLGSWLGALLSLSVGIALHVITSEAVENDARTRFGHMTRNVQSTLESRFKTYADVLRGTASLFRASGDVTREEFSRYVDALDLPHNFPGVEDEVGKIDRLDVAMRKSCRPGGAPSTRC
jgi:CHASE1-domain containing sensor protein